MHERQPFVLHVANVSLRDSTPQLGTIASYKQARVSLMPKSADEGTRERS